MLSEVEAYEQLAEAVPVVEPVEISNWNADVIVEQKDATTHSSRSLDTQGWCLFTTGVQEKGAISDDSRMVVSKRGIKYQLADYTQNNAYILKNAWSWTPLTFAKPVECEEVYILMICANGDARLSTQIQYEDNSVLYTSCQPSDWFENFNDGNAAVRELGRIKRGAADEFKENDIDDRYQFRLYEFEIATDASKKIKAIKFLDQSWGNPIPTVLAISRKGIPLPTSIHSVASEQGEVKIIGIYNLQGMKLNAPVKGLNIIKFSNGTTKKVMIQ